MDVAIKIFGKEIFGFKAEKRNYSDISNPAEWLTRSLGGANVAGVNVNQNSSLNFSGYYGSVKILMETMGILPSNSIVSDKGTKKIIDHPANRLLNKKPNRYMTPQLWKETMMGYACNKGNAYAFIVRDSMMNPTELLMPENQGDIQPFVYEGDLFYKVSGMVDPFPASEIFHIRGLGFDGIKGLSLISVAKSYIGGGLAAQQYSNDIFSSGGAERVAIKIPKVIDDTTEEKMKKEWARKYGKYSDDKAQVAILQAGMDVEKIGISPEDAQTIESKNLSIVDFSRYTRIPLFMLNIMDGQGYNSLEELGRSFTFTMLPWITKFEQEANEKLFRESQKKDHGIRFEISRLTSMDSKSMAEFFSKLTPLGAYNPDEIRERTLGMNPREDGGGGIYRTAVNLHTDGHAKAKEEKILSEIKSQKNE